MEEPSAAVAVTGETGMLQWGHGGERRGRRLGGRRGRARSSLQWGHGGDAVEDGDVLPVEADGTGCFNGATAVTPWKTLKRLAARPSRRSGFNGATAVTPWKTTSCTEPRRSRAPSFNGATAVRPWKTAPRPSDGWDRRMLLQWGHGGDAVEDGRTTPASSPRARASMGPRR